MSGIPSSTCRAELETALAIVNDLRERIMSRIDYHRNEYDDYMVSYFGHLRLMTTQLVAAAEQADEAHV